MTTSTRRAFLRRTAAVSAGAMGTSSLLGNSGFGAPQEERDLYIGVVVEVESPKSLRVAVSGEEVHVTTSSATLIMRGDTGSADSVSAFTAGEEVAVVGIREDVSIAAREVGTLFRLVEGTVLEAKADGTVHTSEGTLVPASTIEAEFGLNEMRLAVPGQSFHAQVWTIPSVDRHVAMSFCIAD